MKNAPIWQMLACGLAGMASATVFQLAGARADAVRATANPDSRIGLINIAAVFKSDPVFRDKMEMLKAEMVTVFEVQMQARRAELEPKPAELEKLDSRAREELVAARLEQLRREFELKQKEYLAKEAQIYNATYKRITESTTEIANENGLRLVVRFSNEIVDASDRAAVLQMVNRPVILEDQLDISDKVLKRLASKSGKKN